MRKQGFVMVTIGLIFGGIFGFYADAFALNWKSIGPEGGTVLSFAVDPQTPTTVYAGTLNGGVFKSRDGGATWRPANRGLAAENADQTNLKVTALVVNPANPRIVYAGTQNGVFKSVDEGNSWQAANAGITNTNVLALVLHPTSPDTLYVGILNGGVYRSDNGGAGWSPMNNGLTHGFSVYSGYALAIHPSNPEILYVGTDGAGIFRSVNGGGSWSPINTGLPILYVSALAIDPQTPSTLYAGIVSSGVYKSTNGGDNWGDANTELTHRDVNVLTLDPANPKHPLCGDGIERSFPESERGRKLGRREYRHAFRNKCLHRLRISH